MKRILFVLFLFLNINLLLVAEPLYKKVLVNGEKVYRSLKETSITEYDSKGNKIHYKDSYGSEEWNEYDSKGNIIHYKDSAGYEYWYEYDSKGNILKKTSYCNI